jgi:hypothetical protein
MAPLAAGSNLKMKVTSEISLMCIVSERRRTMTWNNIWIHTAQTRFTTARRKGVISHVVVLMGFAGIMTRYVSSHVISLFEEKNFEAELSTWNRNVFS